MGNTKTFDNSEQLIKLPGSFPNRKSFQICIHIAKGKHQEPLLHRFLASIRMLFFFFLKTFSLLRAARCSTTLDKFTDLKSPHKCFLNCSVLSGSSASLVPGSHHVSILQSLFIFIFMHSPNRKPVVIRICILVIAATLPTPRAPSASWKVPQSEGSHYSQQTHKRENRQSHRRREFKTPQPFLIVPGNMQTRVLPSRKQEPEVGLD